MFRHTLKPALKRGALIAAANWPVTLVQASADSLFKLLLAAPIIGGVFLVALAVGSEPSALISLEWREMAATVTESLTSRPAVLVAFLLAVGVVAVGGSLFIFLVKAGTVATLVGSDRDAGPIEDPPLRVSMVARASRFSVDGFSTLSLRLFPRYAQLGFILMLVYVVSALGYLALIANRPPAEGWSATALITAALVVWVTIVNLLYLLTQIVIAADDCTVATALRRVGMFLRHAFQDIAAIFLLVLGLIVAATAASLLATAALGLVAFVPFFGLAAIPLQLLAWLLRGLVFQYLGLTSVGAYLKLYRRFSGAEVLRSSGSGSMVLGLEGSQG
jgi:hypothetical protein